jgi:16S rRNA (guanine527-N7)-methyltransferase
MILARSARTLAERLADDRQTALRLVPVSRETEKRLSAFVDLLGRWQKAINLVSESSLTSVWTRHIADSAQLIGLVPGVKRCIDLGSGAGFPGIVIAIQLAGIPGAAVHCIETDRRKCAFLREAARVTGAPATIHPVRVETIDPEMLGAVDAVTARAIAPLRHTLELAKVWLELGAIGIFPRGRSVDDQLEALPAALPYAIESVPSVVDPKSAILRIRLCKELSL